MYRSHLLDMLRILAIALVFIAHIGQMQNSSLGAFFGIKSFYYVSLGGLGVSMFLILSGILAGLVEAQKKSAYLEYMIKKLLRIYPLYWMAVITGFVGYLVGQGGVAFWAVDWFPSGIGIDLIGSLTGFYSWMGLWGGPYNPPTWFIALIMSLYALFPLLAVAMKRYPHSTLLVLFIISVGSRYYLGQNGLPIGERYFWDGMVEYAYRQYGFMPGRPTDWFPLCRIFEFGLGVYLALMINKAFWFKLQLKWPSAITFLSDIAFPLFLVHYPFLFLIEWLTGAGVNIAIAITAYMGFVVVLAFFLSRIDEKIPRKLIVTYLCRSK